LKEKLAREPSEIGGKKIETINRMDGVKFIFADKSWMLMRRREPSRWSESTPKLKIKMIWRCCLNKVAVT
jgi:phosphomannomutase